MRTNAAHAVHSTHVCGCEFSVAKFESDVQYFHSVTDDILLEHQSLGVLTATLVHLFLSVLTPQWEKYKALCIYIYI